MSDILIVVQRFGDEVVGGSEAVMREAAEGLAVRGWDVDVLTTCARDHYTWRNEYSPGVTKLPGMTIRRFQVVRSSRPSSRKC